MRLRIRNRAVAGEVYGDFPCATFWGCGAFALSHPSLRLPGRLYWTESSNIRNINRDWDVSVSLHLSGR